MRRRGSSYVLLLGLVFCLFFSVDRPVWVTGCLFCLRSAERSKFLQKKKNVPNLSMEAGWQIFFFSVMAFCYISSVTKLSAHVHPFQPTPVAAPQGVAPSSCILQSRRANVLNSAALIFSPCSADSSEADRGGDFVQQNTNQRRMSPPDNSTPQIFPFAFATQGGTHSFVRSADWRWPGLLHWLGAAGLGSVQNWRQRRSPPHCPPNPLC